MTKKKQKTRKHQTKRLIAQDVQHDMKLYIKMLLQGNVMVSTDA